MAEPQPTTFLNVIALAIAILPFFATNALDRLDQLCDEGKEGYMKFGIIVTLLFAFFVTVLVTALFLNIGGATVGGLQITGAYFLFVALYLPTLALLIPAFDKGIDLWCGHELHRGVLSGIILLVGVVVIYLIGRNPV